MDRENPMDTGVIGQREPVVTSLRPAQNSKGVCYLAAAYNAATAFQSTRFQNALR